MLTSRDHGGDRAPMSNFRWGMILFAKGLACSVFCWGYAILITGEFPF